MRLQEFCWMPIRPSPYRLPPMNALKMFESSARHLNFRLAADEIGLTQRAVAQQVRGLEEFLGAKLFNRLARGLELTEAGRRYLKPVLRARAYVRGVPATKCLRTETGSGPS